MTLDGFLTAHGSALILPLAVIEGPIVSILAGILSARGDFHWYWALCLLICGDVIGDVLYYWVGRSSRVPLNGLSRLLGLRNLVTPALLHGIRHNATRMLFIGKWTHSIGCLVLVGSGMLRLPFSRFVVVSLLATVPKSALLFGFGYFASHSYPLFQRHFVFGAITLCILGAAAILLILRRTDRTGASGIGP